MSMGNKESANVKAAKDLIALVLWSILVFLVADLLGGYEALEKWSGNGRLSAVHITELTSVVAIVGFASALFFIRQYKEAKQEALERKQAEEVLRQSWTKALEEQEEMKSLFKRVEDVKNEWERTLDCMGGMVILINNEGNVRRCNKAFKDFTRKTFSELHGKKLASLLAEQGIEAKDWGGTMLETYCRRRHRWFELTSNTYKDFMTGDIAGSVVIIRDITERKEESSRPPLGIEGETFGAGLIEH